MAAIAIASYQFCKVARQIEEPPRSPPPCERGKGYIHLEPWSL